MSGTVTTDFSDTVAQGSIVTHTVISIAMAMPNNALLVLNWQHQSFPSVFCIAAIPILCFVTGLAKLTAKQVSWGVLYLYFLPFLHLDTPSEIQFSWEEVL